jgi:WD40 repeat protein
MDGGIRNSHRPWRTSLPIVSSGTSGGCWAVACNDALHLFAVISQRSLFVYRLKEQGTEQLQRYTDVCVEERYRALTWATLEEGQGSSFSVIAVGGRAGPIKIINCERGAVERVLKGHRGSGVWSLQVHPLRPQLLLSSGEDTAIRLWNISFGECIAIFGGHGSHLDDVLTCDFHPAGDKFLSAGADHRLCVWSLKDEDRPAYKRADLGLAHHIQSSADPRMKGRGKLERVDRADLVTEQPHRQHIDCAQWYGDGAILSKSTDNVILLWTMVQTTAAALDTEQKPAPALLPVDPALRPIKTDFVKLGAYPLSQCDLWGIRFSVDLSRHLLAIGNTKGQVMLWDLAKQRVQTMCHPQSRAPVWQTVFTHHGSLLFCTQNNYIYGFHV